MTESVDTREVVTRIYPKAYNGYTITNNGYVDSDLINNYPIIKAAVMSFEDVKMRADASEDDEENGVTICDTQAELDAALTQKCKDQFASGLDKPKYPFLPIWYYCKIPYSIRTFLFWNPYL